MEKNWAIRDYLCDEARRLNERSLVSATDASAWWQERPGRLHRYLETLGLGRFPPSEERPPLNVRITRTLRRPGYRIENLHYESLPGLHVTASLYLPEGSAPFPAILYFCGHAPSPRAHYQSHARLFAQLGFVVLSLDTIMFGEATGVHHGLYNRGFWHWTSRGYNPAAAELVNGIRAIDLLQARPEVDASRIGATGISGGGGTSWWVGAADERVRAIAAVCGTGTDASHVIERAIDGHCDCLLYPNTDGWDLGDVYALLAPRPALIAAAVYDDSYAPAGVQAVHGKLLELYRALGAEDHLQLVETPCHHAYHPLSRTAIFSFFLRRLQGRDVPPDQVGDVDDSPEAREPPESFTVYGGGPPAANRVTTIQDEWIRLAEPPQIAGQDELAPQRTAVVAALRQRTFAAFPAAPCPLDAQLEWEWGYGSSHRVQQIAFTSEPGWRLRLHLHGPPGGGEGSPPAVGAPVLAVLRSPEEPRWQGEGFVQPFVRGSGQDWRYAFIETRGIGETAWGRDLHWHVRRALPLLGRTVASMRVYDTLRALAALRTLSGVTPGRIALAAMGEMGAVALYAALLDGGVSALVLRDPPATQNAPSAPDGSGPAIEMLQCLRITDLPQVAGLLWPAELVFIGEVPQTYGWAEDLYARLGTPGRVSRLQHLGEWTPAAGAAGTEEKK